MKRGLPEWAQRRLDPTQRYGLRLTLFGLAAVLVAVPFSFLLLQVLGTGPVTEVDRDVAQAVYDVTHDSQILIAISRVLSFLGVPPWFYLTIGASALWFYKRGFWRVSLFLVATPLIGGTISSAVKILVDRPRPFFDEPIAEALGKSFPSGHAMSATVGYGTMLLAFLPFIPRRWRTRAIVGYVVLVLLIAASRLGLGVHYLSDVIGGIILGAAWLAVSVAIFRVWRIEQRKPTVDLVEGAEPEVARNAS
ncbi:MAG: phosphatase PAP2 family protein [Actinobacteria bacterium]|nr:phosphatase PAP2 family protein [Actinomycetota bacterium]